MVGMVVCVHRNGGISGGSRDVLWKIVWRNEGETTDGEDGCKAGC